MHIPTPALWRDFKRWGFERGFNLMDTILVIATQNQQEFQEFLQTHVALGYAIVHCNSFFSPAHNRDDGQRFDSAIQYVAVLQLP